MISFLWFMTGVVVCRFFFFFGVFTGGGKIVKIIELECLRLLSIMNDQYLYSSKMRHIWVDGKLDSEKLKILKNMEDDTVIRWRKIAVKSLIENYPKQYRGMIEYHNWSGAMEHLQAHLIQDKSKK
jgi:hypothetical protein